MIDLNEKIPIVEPPLDLTEELFELLNNRDAILLFEVIIVVIVIIVIIDYFINKE